MPDWHSAISSPPDFLQPGHEAVHMRSSWAFLYIACGIVRQPVVGVLNQEWIFELILLDERDAQGRRSLAGGVGKEARVDACRDAHFGALENRNASCVAALDTISPRSDGRATGLHRDDQHFHTPCCTSAGTTNKSCRRWCHNG